MEDRCENCSGTCSLTEVCQGLPKVVKLVLLARYTVVDRSLETTPAMNKTTHLSKNHAEQLSLFYKLSFLGIIVFSVETRFNWQSALWMLHIELINFIYVTYLPINKEVWYRVPLLIALWIRRLPGEHVHMFLTCQSSFLGTCCSGWQTPSGESEFLCFEIKFSRLPVNYLFQISVTLLRVCWFP